MYAIACYAALRDAYTYLYALCPHTRSSGNAPTRFTRHPVLRFPAHTTVGWRILWLYGPPPREPPARAVRWFLPTVVPPPYPFTVFAPDTFGLPPSPYLRYWLTRVLLYRRPCLRHCVACAAVPCYAHALHFILVPPRVHPHLPRLPTALGTTPARPHLPLPRLRFVTFMPILQFHLYRRLWLPLRCHTAAGLPVRRTYAA